MLIDLNWYSQLDEHGKFEALKAFEGCNIKNLVIENMKHKMHIVEVVSIDTIVVRLVNSEDNNKTRLEFLNDEEFMYYLKLNNNTNKEIEYCV